MTGSVRGVGLGLRWEFLDELVERTRESGELRPALDFLEIAPENYIRRGGSRTSALRWLAERYPTVTHGLTMSLGGTDPLDADYLRDLKGVLAWTESPWHSDHLCFGAVGGRVLHELLPVAFKESAVDRIAARIARARDVLGVPLAIENVSYYWHPGRQELSEPEFLTRVCEASSSSLLLDVNNAFVNCQNFGLSVDEWVRRAPLERVVQIHVAGHQWFQVDDSGMGDETEPHAKGSMIIDTHGAAVGDPVLDLLERVLTVTGPVPVVLERDQNIPSLDVLIEEVAQLRRIWQRSSALRSEQGAAFAEVRKEPRDIGGNVGR